MATLLMAMCEPTTSLTAKQLSLGVHHWLPGSASVVLGPACTALRETWSDSSQAAWPHAFVASCLLWLPVLCAFTIGFLLRAQMGSARYLTPPGLGFRRAWLACSAAYAVSSVWRSYTPRGTFHHLVSVLTGVYWPTRANVAPPSAAAADCGKERSSARVAEMLCEEDLSEFIARVERQPAEKCWTLMMEKTTADVYYVAWRHILPDGGTEYFSRTVVEDADADRMIAFYNHDERRLKWDGLLVDASVLDVDAASGTECVWWKRNLPCCGFRDYVFGRRTWRQGDNRYTVCKGSNHPRRPRNQGGVIRVDPFYSGWRIRPVPSRTGAGKMAVETVLIHYEEFSIQHDVARFAVRTGMWGVVKNLCKGYRLFHDDVQADPNLLKTSLSLATPEAEEEEDGKRMRGKRGLVRKVVGTAARVAGAALVAHSLRKRSLRAHSNGTVHPLHRPRRIAAP